MGIYFGDGRAQAMVMLGGAVGALYAATRVAGLALDREHETDPSRRAIVQCVSIAGVALTAVFFGRSDIALSIIFSSSLGFLMLVAGITTFLMPLRSLPTSKNVWPLLFPVALLVLMEGMSGHLSWWHGLILMAMGGAILAVWMQSSEVPPLPVVTTTESPVWRRTATLSCAVVVATVVGSILALKGTIAACTIIHSENKILDPGIFAAAILSPLLIVPTLGTATAIAQRGDPAPAVTALLGSVFLNLCLLLPIAVLIWQLDPSQWSTHVTKFYNIRWSRWHWMPFDLPAWQIETVSLVVIGFALVPVSIGRWAVGRVESVLLIVAYGGYIIMLVVFGVMQM